MSEGGQMTAAGPAGQDKTRPAGGGQQREREVEVEVEEILPGHLDYRDGQGRAFHVWTVTRASKYGLGKLSEAQLRELGRQIGHLLGPAATGPEEDHGPDRSHEAAAAGPPETPAAPAGVVASDDTRDPASREGTGSGAAASDRPPVRPPVH
jgi:hypothetical protein